MADEAGVEAVNLGLFDDLVLAAAVEGPHDRNGMGGFEGAEVALDGGPRDADSGGGFGDFELAAALTQEVFKHSVEAVHVPEFKQPVDVAGEERVHPFAVEGGGLGVGQQRRGQAAVEEALRERDVAEHGQFTPRYRDEMDDAFAAGEGVAELFAGREGGRTSGQDLELGKNVGTDLEQATGVAELVDLVEDHHRLGAGLVEGLRVADHFFKLGQVAVHVKDTIRAKTFGQGGLATAADTAQPGYGNLPPSFFYPVNPKWSFKHATVVCVPSGYM